MIIEPLGQHASGLLDIGISAALQQGKVMCQAGAKAKLLLLGLLLQEHRSRQVRIRRRARGDQRIG
ncbi:hypothetical protein GCM10027214_05950 [Stenotrophomonas tumulicola]